MAKIILKDGEYTFDASERTITLAAPYDGLNQGQIISIFNLTTHDQIFEVGRRKYTISLSGAVITHTYDNTQHADTDKLSITIETELESLTDVDTVFFENESVEPNAIIGEGNPGKNIQGDLYKTLFFSAIKNFTVSVQLTDESSANPDWYNLCDSTGAVVTFTFSGNGSDAYKRAVPIHVKGIKMRVTARNTDTVADTPYCGVI